jgi:VanZ family protein
LQSNELNPRTSNPLRTAAWAVVVVYWVAMLIATHLPPERLPTTHVSDKVENFVGYALLTTLLLLALSRGTARLTMARIITIVAIVLIYGAFDELTQPWFRRTCSLGDWIADAGGTIAAAAMTLVGSASFRA